MFSENLKTLMKQRKITQTELSIRLGVSKQTVNAWYKGRKIPRMKTLLKICEVLECHINDLADPDQGSIKTELEAVMFRLNEEKMLQLLDYAKYLEKK